MILNVDPAAYALGGESYCGLGVCAAMDGHKGTCAEASGWDSEDVPHRVRLSRAKGWRKPDNTVVVSRPSKWGNPFTVSKFKQVRGGRAEYSVSVHGGCRSYIQSERYAREIAADEYRAWLKREHLGTYDWHWTMIRKHAVILDALRAGELRGKNLACWCPLEDADGNHVPCHADVLLELANPGWKL